MTQSLSPGGQEAHEGMNLNRTVASLLGSLVIWGAVAGVCLWFLDYRSLFLGGYELVTFRHVQLGLAAFSGWRALEALRELLMPPEADSPIRRWTRWIPLTWLSLLMCLASLLAMLHFPEALLEASWLRPTNSYKSHPLLPPFFIPVIELTIGSLGLVWIWSCTFGINRPVAAPRRVTKKEERLRDFLVTSQKVRFAAAGMIAGAVALGATLLGPVVRSAGSLASLSAPWPASMWVLGGVGIAAMLVSATWFFCRTRQGHDPYLVVKWVDYFAIIAAIASLLTVFALLPEAWRLFPLTHV